MGMPRAGAEPDWKFTDEHNGRSLGMTENDHKHPSQYTNEELVALLRAARRSVQAEMLTLQYEVRERVHRMEALKQRLAEIEKSERELTGDG